MKWFVELRREERTAFVIEAPDPASRDAIAFGTRQQMDHNRAVPDALVKHVGSELHEWKIVNVHEVRPGEE